MFGYTSKTVSYAKELTSVSICYSQGNGFNSLLPRSLRSTVHASQFRDSYSSVIVGRSGGTVLCSVVRLCLVPTSGYGNKYYVCTLPTSPRINRPSHLDHHAHAS